ncbi:helix-turn-helix domain-containing protein [Haloarchaeobius amylolyticus]|uniref:helix-turn-helix domain-containing protein n=1 Tax=Haloarchaeobius amylolyticus TaxID=1198296 RepID=UPI00226FB186|nr:helix-turn-helix domain-containing protein [Haloarchaeobius amylolyticus]
MRAVTFTLGRPDSPHIAYRMFDPDSAFEREEIYHLNVLADGSVVLLGRVRGDLEVVRRLLDEEADVLGYSISQADGRSGLAYVHARPPPEMKEFLQLPRTHEVLFDFPLESTSDGRLEVVMIGETNAVLQEALAAIPGELAVRVERIGPYPDPREQVVSLLTDRQREVLDVALDLGYYDIPRQATHRDIADQLGLSVGTVSEHLQKVESTVFGHIRT